MSQHDKGRTVVMGPYKLPLSPRVTARIQGALAEAKARGYGTEDIRSGGALCGLRITSPTEGGEQGLSPFLLRRHLAPPSPSPGHTPGYGIP